MADFPPPQKKVKVPLKSYPWLLTGLIVIFFILIFSVLQENATKLSLPSVYIFKINIWDIQLLGTNVSASIFTALLGLLFLRKHFIHGNVPILDYRCQTTGKSVYQLETECDSGRFFVTDLTNTGEGCAIITDAKYKVQVKDDTNSSEYGNRESVVALLTEHSIRLGQDYALIDFGNNTAIAANESRRIFEILESKLNCLKTLDIKLTFLSTIHDKYVKEVWCIRHEDTNTQEH